jgi:hypothetical protein
MTHYLKFPDETTGMAALDAAGLIYTDDDGNQAPITASLDHALDVVGTIYRSGTIDAETGEMITPPIPRPGWHVNYIGTLPDGWDAYVVEPLRPSRVFA